MENKEILNEVAKFAREVNNLYIELLDKISHSKPAEGTGESGKPPIPLGFVSLEQRQAMEQAAYNKLRAEQMQAAQMKAEADAIINSEGVSQATAVRRKWFGSGNNKD